MLPKYYGFSHRQKRWKQERALGTFTFITKVLGTLLGGKASFMEEEEKGVMCFNIERCKIQQFVSIDSFVSRLTFIGLCFCLGTQSGKDMDSKQNEGNHREQGAPCYWGESQC